MFGVVASTATQLQFGDRAKGFSFLATLRHSLVIAAEHAASWRVIPPPSRSSMLPRRVEGQSPSTLVGSPHPLSMELAAAGRTTQRRAVAGYVAGCPPIGETTGSSMTVYGPSLRLALLLQHLTTDQFKPLPVGVGRKTVNLAEEAGLVEVSDRSAAPRCRLTDAGLAHRRANPYRFDG